MLLVNASDPLATLKSPLMLSVNAWYPLATLCVPVMLDVNAFTPIVVFVLIFPEPVVITAVPGIELTGYCA